MASPARKKGRSWRAILIGVLLLIAALPGGGLRANESDAPRLALRVNAGQPVLEVAWERPVPAAAFIRAGRLWLLFGAASQPAGVAPDLAAAMPGLRWSEHRQLTILQMDAPATGARVERAGSAWLLHFGPDSEPPDQLARWSPPSENLSVAGISGIEELPDDIVGDWLGIGLRLDPGQVSRPVTSPDLQVLPSLQGLVWRAASDQVTAALASGRLTLGVGNPAHAPPTSHAARSNGPTADHDDAAETVALAGGDLDRGGKPSEKDAHEAAIERAGLTAATAGDGDGLRAELLLAPEATMTASPDATTLARRSIGLDLAGASAPDRPRDVRLELQRRVTWARGADQIDARHALARYLLAIGLGAEAAAALAPLRDEVRLPPTAALAAIASLLQDRAAEALGPLSSPELDTDPEAAWWRATAAAEAGRLAAALPMFDRAEPVGSGYPLPLRLRIALAEAMARLGAAQPAKAVAVLDRLKGTALTGPDRARVGLMRGEALAALGRAREADAAWALSEADGDPALGAAARHHRIMAALGDRRLDAAERRSGWRRTSRTGAERPGKPGSWPTSAVSGSKPGTRSVG
jgi:hypothetical protein